jgi:hypothetical protein
MGRTGVKAKVKGVLAGAQSTGYQQVIGYYPAFGCTGVKHRFSGCQMRLFNDKTG